MTLRKSKIRDQSPEEKARWIAIGNTLVGVALRRVQVEVSRRRRRKDKTAATLAKRLDGWRQELKKAEDKNLLVKEISSEAFDGLETTLIQIPEKKASERKAYKSGRHQASKGDGDKWKRHLTTKYLKSYDNLTDINLPTWKIESWLEADAEGKKYPLKLRPVSKKSRKRLVNTEQQLEDLGFEITPFENILKQADKEVGEELGRMLREELKKRLPKIAELAVRYRRTEKQMAKIVVEELVKHFRNSKDSPAFFSKLGTPQKPK